MTHTMQQVFKHILLFLFYITISYAAAAAADFLQNPDFEIPPANLSSNATSQKWLLTGANSIRGWSVNGTVWYVASTGNASFPNNGGHAVQLGPNGKINQTFIVTKDDVLHYVLSFTLGAQNTDCANNRTALNVTLRDSYGFNVSRVIHMQLNSSRDLWESHALFLGQLGGKDFVQIEIKSVATDNNSQDYNVTCWPLVDAFAVKRNELPRWYDGNSMSNDGFEVGPAFVKNSPNGIILNEEEDMHESPLQQWAILGTVRYIDSSHYRVPRRKAAVELLSGGPSGVKKVFTNLPTTYLYTLNFTMGDANDSCVADFVVYVQVGSSIYNFTMKSNGSGSAFKQTLKFRVEESPETSITFYSFNETRTRDGVLCGPVLDDIFLTGSYGERLRVCNGVLVLNLFIAFVLMMILM